MPIQLISISADSMTVGQLKVALQKYDDETLVHDVSEVRPGNEALGILTFLINDVSKIEGLFDILEEYNRTGKWRESVPLPPPPPPRLYQARVIRESQLRDQNGQPVGNALPVGTLVDVYSEPRTVGAFSLRVDVDPATVVPRRNIWLTNIQRL